MEELRDDSFVSVKKGYGTRDLVDSVCQTVGFIPKYVYEGDEPTRLFALVEAEIGIAFIPSTAMYSQDHIHYLRIENLELLREIALVWLTGGKEPDTALLEVFVDNGWRQGSSESNLPTAYA